MAPLASRRDEVMEACHLSNVPRGTAWHDRIIFKVESVIATHPDVVALPLSGVFDESGNKMPRSVAT